MTAIHVPTPNEIQSILDAKTLHSEALLLEFSAKMNDPQYVVNMRYGTAEEPYWQIACKGCLSKGDKEYITYVLVNAGWAVDEIKNSEDNQERAGMCSVRVSFPKKEG